MHFFCLIFQTIEFYNTSQICPVCVLSFHMYYIPPIIIINDTASMASISMFFSCIEWVRFGKVVSWLSLQFFDSSSRTNVYLPTWSSFVVCPCITLYNVHALWNLVLFEALRVLLFCVPVHTYTYLVMRYTYIWIDLKSKKIVKVKMLVS